MTLGLLIYFCLTIQWMMLTPLYFCWELRNLIQQGCCSIKLRYLKFMMSCNLNLKVILRLCLDFRSCLIMIPLCSCNLDVQIWLCWKPYFVQRSLLWIGLNKWSSSRGTNQSCLFRMMLLSIAAANLLLLFRFTHYSILFLHFTTIKHTLAEISSWPCCLISCGIQLKIK